MATLITGCNRGLGLEFVRQCLARGERVIASARHPARAHELTRLAGEHPGHLQVFPLEIGDARSITEFAREVRLLEPRLERVIHNAGVMAGRESFGQVRSEDLARSFAVNASGPLLLTQALADHLAAPARLVYISSVLGSIGARDGFYTPSYSMSKAALNMAVRQISFALADRAISVAMHPGWVRTDMGGEQAPLQATTSVRAMLARIDALSPSDNGRFLAHDGGELPW